MPLETRARCCKTRQTSFEAANDVNRRVNWCIDWWTKHGKLAKLQGWAWGEDEGERLTLQAVTLRKHGEHISNIFKK